MNDIAGDYIPSHAIWSKITATDACKGYKNNEDANVAIIEKQSIEFDT